MEGWLYGGDRPSERDRSREPSPERKWRRSPPVPTPAARRGPLPVDAAGRLERCSPKRSIASDLSRVIILYYRGIYVSLGNTLLSEFGVAVSRSHSLKTGAKPFPRQIGC